MLVIKLAVLRLINRYKVINTDGIVQSYIAYKQRYISLQLIRKISTTRLLESPQRARTGFRNCKRRHTVYEWGVKFWKVNHIGNYRN